MLYKKIFFILSFQLFLTSLFSENSLVQVTIQGNISDFSSGETLPGASVLIVETKSGYVSDNDGNYLVTLQQSGNYTLKISYVGYEAKEVKINAIANQTIDIQLSASIELQEVVVTAQKADENITRISMGVEKLKIGQIKKTPALMGEVDVIKAIQLLPGVQAATEGGSGFSVRGGSPDQNLILLDNTTIYNASHLLGFFSVFNTDVIDGLELYKGDIPVKHGGRISSLLDIRTVEQQPEKLTGTGGLGLISSRLVLQGPIGEKTSWLVGGRRSYADLFLGLSNDKSLQDMSLYFYDMNAKLTHRFSAKDKLAVNTYFGHDNFGSDIFGFNYGNMASSLTWSHVFGESVLGKFSANVSDYNYQVKTEVEGAAINWKSSILDVMLRADFNQYINNSFQLTYGATATFRDFNPGSVKSQEYDEYKTQVNKAMEYAFYLSNEQKISDAFTLKYGLRYTVFQNVGKADVYQYDDNYEVADSIYYDSKGAYHTYGRLDPQIGLLYKVSENSSLKANYAHNTQFIQLANSSTSGSPLDLWFSASPNIKPQEVNLFSAGYFHNFKNNTFETSVEVYYKSLNNVIDFTEHADLLLNQYLEGEVRTGKGKAYGAEFMLKKNTGKLNGFVNYTISRSERTIPEINGGKSYLSPYDKTHSLNIVLNYDFSKKWSFSACWIYATGTPTTYPTGRFPVGGEYFPIYSGRNEYRKPNYDRLDLSCTFRPNPDSKKRWKSEWNFSLYNAYGRKNPYIISFDQDKTTGIPFAESTYLFSIVPSITYNFKF